jgi:hypothetical protein
VNGAAPPDGRFRRLVAQQAEAKVATAIARELWGSSGRLRAIVPGRIEPSVDTTSALVGFSAAR